MYKAATAGGGGTRGGRGGAHRGVRRVESGQFTVIMKDGVE